MSKMQIKLYKQSWTEQKHRIKMEYIIKNPEAWLILQILVNISRYLPAILLRVLQMALDNAF